MLPVPCAGPLAALGWLDAIILGLVEGLTEYLPVSSTGHLILAAQWLGLQGDEAVKNFEIVIQSGAILAVLGLYRERVRGMVAGLFGRDAQGLRLLLHIALAFLPAAILGVTVEGVIKERLFFAGPVAGALVAGGVAMIVLDRVYRARRERDGRPIEGLTVPGAIVIGLFQCLALWPGTSRSLVTILGALVVGLSPVAAAEFSFLLALPTLGGATAYDLLKNGTTTLSGVGPGPALVGITVAALSAAFAVKGFVAWLVRHGLVPFGVYRIVVGALVLAFW